MPKKKPENRITLASVNAQRRRMGWEEVGKPKLLARIPQPTMNKTEQRYADLLEVMKRVGEIDDYESQPEALVLSEKFDCRYTPDFKVMKGLGIWYVEIKGAHIWDDSIIKWKWAADKFPQFGFKMIQWKDGKWTTIRNSDSAEADSTGTPAKASEGVCKALEDHKGCSDTSNGSKRP